ncbi:MAG: FecR domain-containing protein [Marinilabiliaceae bacterium]|nr:FecR domain-containing protein [Marinilabiliaceae bacterium]
MSEKALIYMMGMMELNQIIKVLKNELSEDEKAAFYKQLESDEQLRELYYQQKNIWVKTGFSPVLTANERKEDISTIWKKITPNNRNQFLHVFQRYAAVIVVTLLLGGMAGYFINELVPAADKHASSVFSFSTGERSMSQVELPDGSVLNLNAHTTVTYQKELETQNRLVTLSGEAYFEVVHNEKSPFVIDFGTMQIVDLGTAFNVKANEQSDFIETTLIEGDVDIVLNKTKKTNLSPGQKATYSKSQHQVVLVPVDSKKVTAWKENRFIFKDQTLASIMEELSAWYGVEIHWDRETHKNERMHLNIERSNSIKSVLEILALSVDVEFDIVKSNSDQKKVIIK